ncbi:MAG: ATP-binding cassette domain-containing protein [Gammaproteobacteria bacterium]|nr:ATP-binding cassette domain-containing protein [Gammaproteobacteria bacterium]
MSTPNLTEKLVEIEKLNHSYQDANQSKQVLFDVTFPIYAGTNVFLTGYSGSGKTTLVSLIGCLRSVQTGSLKLLGEELNGANENKLRDMRRKIGFVFQHFNLLDFMSIRQNVQQSLELQADFSPRKARIRSEEMLDMVGLGDRVNDYPKALSGGQKQRVAIARALVHKPRLVLADEPTAALDSTTGREVTTLFQSLAEQLKCAVLIVTHNRRVLDVADEILHMEDGRLGTAVGEQLSLVFPTLSDNQLRDIANQAQHRTYYPGDILIREGDVADEFFLLLQGKVEVTKKNSNGQHVKLTELNKRGDYFGEMGLLQENALRAATITARGEKEVAVLTIKKEIFAKMVKDSRLTKALIKDEMQQRIEENLRSDGSESPQPTPPDIPIGERS